MSFNPLSVLLGQQSGVNIGSEIPETVSPTGILVDRNRNQQPNVDPEGPDAPFMGNRSYLDEALTSFQDSVDFSKGERKGMFGVKGTLRDILGTVGDAFLVQSGNKAIYGPQRDSEKMGDALTGFTNSPEAANAAIERLAAAGYTDQAQELQQAMQTAQLKQAQLDSLQTNRDSLVQGRNDKRLEDFRKFASQALASAGDNPASQQYALSLLAQQAKRLGVSLEDIGITEGMTSDQMRVLADAGMPVQNIRNLPLAERRTATGEYNAQTARINANRPRQGRGKTSTELLEEYIDSLPPEEQEAARRNYVTKQTTTSSSSGRSGRSPVKPPNSSGRILSRRPSN